MKAIKIDFSKLIGGTYPLHIKMAVLDWMLKTGKEHRRGVGKWYEIGVSQALFSYSANDYDHVCPLPLPDTCEFDWYFDAIFGRAVYQLANLALEAWREKESIFPGKYRMLKFNDETPADGDWNIYSLLRNIDNFNGQTLKKEFAHPEYKERTEPRIISIEIFTLGHGWIIQYGFSFKKFDYEPGWTQGFLQQENESILSFLVRSYKELVASTCAVEDSCLACHV